MEWLGSTPTGGGGGGAKDIAQQLQNLLQIPAIEKKSVVQSTPSSSTTTNNNSDNQLVESSIGASGVGMKRVPVYCSELEADNNIPSPPPPAQKKEGKENSYPHHVGISRVIVPSNKGGSHPVQPSSKPPPVRSSSRRFKEQNSKVVVKREIREIKDYNLAEYLKDIDYGSSEPSHRHLLAIRMGRPDSKFPSFMETMLELKDYVCPSHFFEQEDLVAKNVIQLDGIENVGEHFMTLDQPMKTMLRTYFIEPLSRKTMKHPKAKFVCKICPYHIDSLLEVIEHISMPRHYQLQRAQHVMYTLENLPMASDQQCASIGELLTSVCLQHGLTDNDKRQRGRIVEFLKGVLNQNGIDCEVSIFGSTAYDLGFKFSNLNINLTFESTLEETKSPALPISSVHLNNVAKVVDILLRIPQFRNVKPKYHMNKTHINFEATEFCGGPNVQCLIQFNNKPALLVAALFQEYMKINSIVRPILMAFRYWAYICEIDDQENGSLPGHAYPIMALQYLQEIRMIPVLQAIPKVDSSRPFATASESFKAGYPNHSERQFSHAELGKLWLSLFYYYAVKFDNIGRVVTISRSGILSTEDGTWNRRLCIEDPILPLVNISRSISSTKICDYIMEAFKLSFVYFAVPSATDYGPIYHGIFDDRLVEDEKRVFYRNCVSLAPSSSEGKQNKVKIIDSSKPLQPAEGYSRPPTSFKMIPFESRYGSCAKFILYSSLSAAHAALTQREYFYEFKHSRLTSFELIPVTCKACGSERHARRNCPEESLPQLTDVKRPTDASLLILRKVIILNYDKVSLNEVAHRARLEIKNHVYSLLVEDFPDVQLTMFGSSENGFGLKSSDLDLCMTLRNQCFITRDDVLRYIDANDTLTKVVNCLKRSHDLEEIFSITAAKVPIVKYSHMLSGVEGDISFYNLLALRNTLLLKAYNQLDARVTILGCLMKKLGKLCEISEASKGSISSYAYMLMLIHYLQHTEKPVLPVLQEIPPLGHNPLNEPLPTYIVEKCDSYFFSDLSKIQYAWKGYGRNTDPVEELWLGFLRYYTEEFDYENHVVSISRQSMVTRREKAWFTDCIAIEDPFEKAHNLGNGLTKRMSCHIIKTLRQFRTVFHSDVAELDDVASARMFYFNRDILKIGKLPIDRQCRICHRIGHIARQCQRVRPSYIQTSEDDDDDEEDDLTQLAEEGSDARTVVVETTTSERNMDVHPTIHHAQQQQSLNYGQYAQRETQNRVLDDFRYFWNMDTPRDHEEMMLEKMISQTSPGVSFSTHLKDKAITMQGNNNNNNNAAMTHHQESNDEKNNCPLLQHLNWNGAAPQINNHIGRVPQHHLVEFSIPKSQFDMTPQSRSCIVTGPSASYPPPPGMIHLPPPPPGFAPRGLAPVKLAMVPTTMMTNGMMGGNENNALQQQRHHPSTVGGVQQQMYRFPGFGQYINFQQLHPNMFNSPNGALNSGPPIPVDSLSWQNNPPHIPGNNNTAAIHHEQQGAHQIWDTTNRH